MGFSDLQVPSLLPRTSYVRCMYICTMHTKKYTSNMVIIGVGFPDLYLYHSCWSGHPIQDGKDKGMDVQTEFNGPFNSLSSDNGSPQRPKPSPMAVIHNYPLLLLLLLSHHHRHVLLLLNIIISINHHDGDGWCHIEYGWHVRARQKRRRRQI